MAAKSIGAWAGWAVLATLAIAIGGALLAISTTTFRANAVMARAETEQAWGRLEAARDAMLHAASITPSNAEIHTALGSVNASIDRFRDSTDARDASIDAYQRAVRLKPLDPGVHAAQAAAYMQFGRLAEAADAYLRALDLDPNNALLLGSLGALRERQERFDDAKELYRAALSIRPSEALEARLEQLERR